MSDSLTPEAPEPDAAATAPAPAEAVEPGSVDSTEVIPKERFNGLMSKYQTEKSAWEMEREDMRAELERLESQAPEEPDHMSDDVLAEVQALRSELAAEKLATARAQAIAEFPGCAPLADLIIGDTPEAVRAMAQTVHERLSAGAPAGASTEDGSDATPPAADAAAPPAAPQQGGAVPVDDTPNVDGDIAAALESKNFSAFIAAANRRAELQQGAELTV